MKQEFKEFSYKILTNLNLLKKIKGSLEFKNKITYITDFGSIVFKNKNEKISYKVISNQNLRAI